MSAPDFEHLGPRLSEGAALLGLPLTATHRDQLLALLTLLGRWNRVFNLTAVREPARMVPYHLLDSLALAPLLRGDQVLDIGTGAGFPGLPLAILQPERNFTLLDANGKKTRFVRQAVMELGLANVRVEQARAESYRSRGKFATILARAFAPLPLILGVARPLLQHPGLLLASKGPGVDKELLHLDTQGDKISTHRLQVPFLDSERVLVAIEID
jgi:16S rRNA (guanine527-N7)-methyltransferase